MWQSRVLGVVVAGMCLLVGCSAQDAGPGAEEPNDPAPSLDQTPVRPPVLEPDLSQLEEAEPVLAQLRQRFTSLTKTIERPDATPRELSRAYGEAGQLFMAAELIETAEACFLNAHVLAPTDQRWPYYLAHIYRVRGEVSHAVEFFERARALDPNDIFTLVWLGEMRLADEEPAEARLVFEHALALDRESAAALFGLGRAAFARQDYLRAAEFLEGALALRHEAVFIHDALAMVYDRLGQRDRVDQNRRLGTAARGGVVAGGSENLLGSDPLIQEVEALLRSPAVFERRGTRAVERGDPATGIALFRRGLERAPDHAGLRLKLGTALAIEGNVEESQAQFDILLERSPENADAHYSLGLLMEGTGQFRGALARYTSAVRYDSTHSDARLRLGRLLRLMGRHDDAMAQFERVMQNDPQQREAAFGHAMVLVDLGRYAEARDQLADGMASFPDTGIYALALSRLLAAAPADAVRDGERALELLEALPDSVLMRDFGETRAMALAEVGRFDEAVTQQRAAIEAVSAVGLAPVAQAMVDDLRRYEAGQPSRTPWRDGELP